MADYAALIHQALRHKDARGHKVRVIFAEVKVATNNKSFPSPPRKGVNPKAYFHHFNWVTCEIAEIILIYLAYFDALKPRTNFQRADVFDQHFNAGLMLIGFPASEQQRAVAQSVAKYDEFSLRVE